MHHAHASATSKAMADDRRLYGGSSARMRRDEASLDAAFALLDDVRAQSFALQLKLRNSLPMRWSDHAFVMQRPRVRAVDENDAPRERGAGGFVSSDACDPLGDTSSTADWSRQRHRRRVEWDVARRIARIDRELQKLPPEQRFWNKTRRGVQQHEQLKQRQQQAQDQARVAPMAHTRVTKTDASTEPTRVADAAPSQWQRSLEPMRVAGGVLKPTQRLTSPVSRSRRSSSATALETEPKPREKKTGARGARRDLQKATDREKQSRASEARGALKALRAAETEPTHAVATSRSSIDQSGAAVGAGAPMLPVALDASRDTETEATADADLRRSSFEDALATASSEPPTAPMNLSFFDPFNDPEASKENAQHRSGHGTRRSQQIGASKSAALTSTLGRRQVLSEYRSGPCLALYGPPPVASMAGDSRHRQLNGGVLRRLFSDLDSDRDGHLNRVETCMALHRLQIAVSAPMIASFFHRVHDGAARDSGKQATERGNVDPRPRLEPLREVINYKQFVAFVTAANERRHGSTKRESHAAARPSREPHAAARTSETAAPATRLVKKTASSFVSEPVAAQYVLDEPSEVEQLEQRVLSDLPDFVLSKLLSETNDQHPATHTRSPLAVMRRSLERWLPRDSIDEKLVEQIAQELLHERLERDAGALQTPDDGSGESGGDDNSGLRRAAAYFEAQPLTSVGGDDALAIINNNGGAMDSDDLDTWFHALSEEQVSGLVHEILKKETKTLPEQTIGTLDGVRDAENPAPTDEAVCPLEKRNDGVESADVVLEDKQTDMIDFLSTHIGMVAEKAVQAAEEEDADASCPNTSSRTQGLASNPGVQLLHEVVQRKPAYTASRASARGPISTRTHLADEILRQSDQQEGRRDADCSTAAIRPSNVTILQRMRQERKRAVASKAATSFGTKPLEIDASRSLVQESTRPAQSPASARNVVSDDDQSSSSLDVEDTAAEETQPPHLPVVEKHLYVALDSIKPFELSASSTYSYASSSVGESSSSSSLFAEFVLPKRQRQQRRKSRTGKRDRSVSSSEDRDSIGSDDLSEGELDKTRVASDLSDGEIYGAARNRVVRQKNTLVFAETGASVEAFTDDSQSSIESGELLRIVSAFGALIFSHSTLLTLPLPISDWI